MERKSVRELNEEERSELANEIFNRNKKDYHEYPFTDEDVVKKEDGTTKIESVELTDRMKEAFDDNKEVRLNFEEKIMFVEK